MAGKVSVLDKNGAVTYYSSYLAARTDIINSIIPHPLIQIWANLNEQIVLLDGVDVWIAPGVTITNSANDTIVDNKAGFYTDSVDCKIFGFGSIKNTGVKSCIKIINSGSKISVECNCVHAMLSLAVYVLPSEKFHLKCNYVYSQNFQAIRIGEFAQTGIVNDVNLNIIKVETGELGNFSSGTTAVSTRGNGYIKFDKIVCNNLGHCLSHQEVSVIAIIRKLLTTANRSGAIAALHVPGIPQGSEDQNLIIYCDEVTSWAGSSNTSSGVSVEFTGGSLSLFARKLYSKNLYGFTCGGNIQKGLICCNEIISVSNYPLNIANYNTEVTIIANFVIGNHQPTVGNPLIVYLFGTTSIIPKCSIKNAYLRNLNSSSDAKGIYFENIYSILTLKNAKIVSGSDFGSNIFLSNGNSIDIFNMGWFGNADIDQSKIIQKIGVGTSNTDPIYNYQTIISPLLD